MKVTRTWEVTISQEILDDLLEKGYAISDLLWTCTEYGNLGEFGKLYLVKYTNSLTKQEAPLCWGTYDDVVYGDDTPECKTEVLYELDEWGATEVEWNVDEVSGK
jgi:hypothetical protein